MAKIAIPFAHYSGIFIVDYSASAYGSKWVQKDLDVIKVHVLNLVGVL